LETEFAVGVVEVVGRGDAGDAGGDKEFLTSGFGDGDARAGALDAGTVCGKATGQTARRIAIPIAVLQAKRMFMLFVSKSYRFSSESSKPGFNMKPTTWIIFLVIGVLSSSPRAAENGGEMWWPQFRGPNS